MQEGLLELVIDTDGRHLGLGYLYQGEKKNSFQCELPVPGKIEAAQRQWLAIHLKDILLEQLPARDLKVSVSPRCREVKEVMKLAEWVAHLVTKTNACLTSIQHKEGVVKSAQNIMVYATEDFEALHHLRNSLTKRFPEKKIYFEAFDPGWDKMKRQWTNNFKYFSVSEFIDYIEKNEIGTVASVNMYYLEYLMRLGIHPVVLFDYLGLEYVTCDYDTYDILNYLNKVAFNHNEWKRFSFGSNQSLFWDTYYGLTNVRYMTYYCPERVEKDYQFAQLDEEYSVLIRSHARLPDIMQDLPEILYVMNSLDPHRLVEEFQNWYFCIKELALNNPKLSCFIKEKINQRLYRINLHGLNLLKYLVLESIRTDREVQLFGDEAWNAVFPQIYQNKYISKEEIKEVYAQRRHLILTLNSNWSYLENNPVINHCINNHTPYLSFNSVATSKELEGLEVFEYRGFADLNAKIDKINDLSQTPALLSSVMHLQELLELSHSEMVESFAQKFNTKDRFQGGFQDKLLQLERDWRLSSMREFLMKYRETLGDHLQKLVFNQTADLRIPQDAKILEFESVQRVLQIYQQKFRGREITRTNQI